MTNAAETNEALETYRGAPEGQHPNPSTFATTLDDYERLLDEACTAAREVDEKLMGGRSPLQPISRNTSTEHQGPPPLLSAKQRMEASNARMVMLGEVLTRLARAL